MRLSVIVCVALFFTPPVRAQEIDSNAIDKAKSFLGSSKRGSFVNGFVHFGTDYLGHTFNKTLTVQDGNRRRVPGHFALVYDYRWSNGGETQLAFLCDTRGNVYRVQALACNGAFQRPFLVANASIKLVGEALYELLKSDLGDGDRTLLRQLIDSADAPGLLQLGLRVQQGNGR